MEQKTVPDPACLDRTVDYTFGGCGGYESLVQMRDDGRCALSVLVNGVHCAACIQKIESALETQDDIQYVRLNFGAKRLLIEWSGPEARANDYVRIVENAGYRIQPYDPQSAEEQSKSEEQFLLLCLGVAGFAAGNIMLLSVGVWSASVDIMGMATRDFLHWVSACIGLPTIIFSGRPFFRSALAVLSKGHTNMDVPISLAVILAGGMSLWETMNHGRHVYFDSAVMLIFFLLIGRYLDFRARKNARGVAHDLLQSFNGFADVLEGGRVKRVLIRDLKPGMLVRVAVGGSFPVDGVIVRGHTGVDMSLVTGETRPYSACPGDQVYAGTVNVESSVDIKVAKAAEDSLLTDIANLVDRAQQKQSVYVRLADRVARLYTPVVHVTALVAFCGWLFIGHAAWQESMMTAITVLIITCPCALGLAVPVVHVLATSALMKRGVLVKSGDALEKLAHINIVMADKTGTLTLGRLSLLGGDYDDHTMRLVASLAAHSRHPLSQALVQHYGGSLLEIKNVIERPGQGIEGTYDGEVIKLGHAAFCGQDNTSASSYTEVWFSDGAHATCFFFQDPLRLDVKTAVQRFSQDGVETVLVSGDRTEIVENIADQSGIHTAYGQKTPIEKFEILEDLKHKSQGVLMVGDGLNDAPVLAGADVSIAPGTAIDIAQNTADIIFMGDNFMPVYEAYKTAQAMKKLVKQNFSLAVLYNLIAIPLAVLGMVTPLVAALAMSGSSLLVVANSFRLRWMI